MRSPYFQIPVRILAVLLCVAGMLLSFYMVQKHVVLNSGGNLAALSHDNLIDKACTTIIPDADCDAAIQSKWGKIGDVPTALLGLYYFTALFWWFLLVGGATRSRLPVYLILGAVMAAGLGFSIFLVFKIRELPQPCTICYGTHAANALLFLCYLLLLPWRRDEVGPAEHSAHQAAATGAFPAPRGPMHDKGDRHWPTGWVLLVLPIILLMSFAFETPGLMGGGGLRNADQANTAMEGLRTENEGLRKLAAGQSAAEELTRLREQMMLAQQQLQQARTQEEGRIKSLNDQIETLRKAAAGQAGGKELADTQDKLKKAENARDYWQKMYNRFESRWQHTYLAWSLNPPLQLKTDHQKIKGPADAPHTITLFSDFQCPTCKKFEETLEARIIPLANRYGGAKVVFKQWPISQGCNAHANFDLHPNACRAALAAEAAYILGGNDAFWKMHDTLFARQDEWKNQKPPDFRPYAQAIGLDVAKFEATMNGPEALANVKADIEEGVALGNDLVQQGLISKEEQEAIKVDSTPTIFIDGRRLQSAQHVRTWQNILGMPPPDWTPSLGGRPPQAKQPNAPGQPAPAGGNASPNPAAQPTPDIQP